MKDTFHPITPRPKHTKTVMFEVPRKESRSLSGKSLKTSIRREKLLKKGDKFRFRKDQDIVNVVKRMESAFETGEEVDFEAERKMISEIKERELGEENDEELEILFRKLAFQDFINSVLYWISPCLTSNVS